MKQNELKSCFESISPTDEQRQKMLDNILRAGKAPARKRINFRVAVSAAVSVAALAAVFAFGFNNVTDNIPLLVGETYKTAKNETVKEKKSSDAASENAVTAVPQQQKVAVADVPKASGKSPAEKKVIKDELTVYDSKVNDAKTDKAADSAAADKIAEDQEYAADEYSLQASAVDGVDERTSKAGGSGATMAVSLYADYERYLADERYSAYVPRIYAEGYLLTYAYADAESLTANFSDGEKDIFLAVNPTGNGARVVKPEEVSSLGSDGQDVTFAVDCKDMYAVYTVPAEDTDKMYEMITSAEYFSNNN